MALNFVDATVFNPFAVLHSGNSDIYIKCQNIQLLPYQKRKIKHTLEYNTLELSSAFRRSGGQNRT